MLFRSKKALILAPGSGAKEKNWPMEFYNIVGKWWEKELGGKVILLFGPAEEESGEIKKSWGDGIAIQGLELARVAALLKRSYFYLGNDSGISHLAAALGVNSVVLFGPSDPIQWAPRGKRTSVISKNVGCSPCAHSIMKACPHRKCLTELAPESVIKVIEGLVEDLQSRD